MNIFILDTNPHVAARMQCDKHVPKMVVESAQMMASALRRHGATDDIMPLTQKGTPYKGGYHHHPCTVWAGDSRMNYIWLCRHAVALCSEYTKRFGKTHACYAPIMHMQQHYHLIDDSPLTTFAQAMPEEHNHSDAVKAYRSYYHTKTFAKWEKGTPAPSWWNVDKVNTTEVEA